MTLVGAPTQLDRGSKEGSSRNVLHTRLSYVGKPRGLGIFKSHYNGWKNFNSSTHGFFNGLYPAVIPVYLFPFFGHSAGVCQCTRGISLNVLRVDKILEGAVRRRSVVPKILSTLGHTYLEGYLQMCGPGLTES